MELEADIRAENRWLQHAACLGAQNIMHPGVRIISIMQPDTCSWRMNPGQNADISGWKFPVEMYVQVSNLH